MPYLEPPEKLHPVLLVRHGETESNVVKRYAGRRPEPLTPRGRLQAQRIARGLRNERPRVIVSSRIARAIETAASIARRQGIEVITDARLDELQMGPWEGLLEAEVARLYPKDWEVWTRRPHELELPGRETLRDIRERVMSIVLEVARLGPSVLVTHVAPIRVATLTALELPLSFYKRVEVPNASCIRLDLANRTAFRYPTGGSIRSEIVGRDGELAIA